MGSGAERRSGNCRLRKMPWDNFLLFAHLKQVGNHRCSWTHGTLVQLGRGEHGMAERAGKEHCYSRVALQEDTKLKGTRLSGHGGMS